MTKGVPRADHFRARRVMQRPAVLFSKLFIGNEFVESRAGKTFPVIDPSTEAVICQVQEANAEDVDTAVQSARKAFALNSPWRTMDASQRGRLLYQLSDEIEKNIDYLTVGSLKIKGIFCSYH
ncbi:unnamed protein product [Dibothriocephalus latus]|uniref:Aldehyde dehydrogenase domain-containing protein n=1 Tax=Dibothriocephalus latus TaxID=60516 RepID=A0A3P7MLA0_DIBLA|nr:unnamed protein product [Dibothriocephalus latus]